MERHPKLAPVSTYTDGVFIAGACQGPKDIPESVVEASGAAAAVAQRLAPARYTLAEKQEYPLEREVEGEESGRRPRRA